MNDTYKHIDLSCLDTEDAITLTKMKLYELAQVANDEYKNKGRKAHYVINIKCAEDHLAIIEDGQGRAPLKNIIVEMINNDLKLDYYYIDTLRTILVRVDEKTIHSKHMCNCRVPEESL